MCTHTHTHTHTQPGSYGAPGDPYPISNDSNVANRISSPSQNSGQQSIAGYSTNTDPQSIEPTAPVQSAQIQQNSSSTIDYSSLQHHPPTNQHPTPTTGGEGLLPPTQGYSQQYDSTSSGSGTDFSLQQHQLSNANPLSTPLTPSQQSPYQPPPTTTHTPSQATSSSLPPAPGTYNETTSLIAATSSSTEYKAPLAQGQPKRLHVSNIPFRFREPDLRHLFYVSSL